jgi:2-hydroxy-3-oxopropionate reductase
VTKSVDKVIAFIGLGLMGKPMARNLHTAGYALTVHNRSRGVVDELAAEGMTPASSPRDAAARSDAVILMLPDTPTVEHVLLGDEGVLAGLEPGLLVIDMGTTAVGATRRFAAEVESAGGVYVDAPVSGGEVGAIEASLAIMCGGTPAGFERARPLLEAMGKHITHVGECGAGQVAKAANQVIVGLTIGAVAEALHLAERSGVDPVKVREAVRGGFAWSRIMELHGQRMIEGRFEPGGKSSTQRKDLQQALEQAQCVGARMPVTELVRDLYDELIEQGQGGLDHSALINVLKQRSPDRE